MPSIALMRFFSTSNDLEGIPLDPEKIHEYLQAQPDQSISMQKDPIELNENRISFTSK